jgi:hypothetical protein
MAKRKSKDDVNYTDLAADPTEQCQGCKFFINGEACAKVMGAIAPEGWCELYAEKEDVKDRNRELGGNENIREQVLKLAKRVDKAFMDQWERGNDQCDYWDIYNTVLGVKQGYSGNSQIYVPIVKEAIDARKTRFVNQIFPRSQRNVECITSDEKPYHVMALLEHYIRRTRLRTQIMPALMINGDVEGQYNIYVGWEDSERHVVYRTKAKAEVEGEASDILDPEADDDMESAVVVHQGPSVEVLSDTDVVVVPVSASSVGDALAKGGVVAIKRIWSKERLKQAVDDGEIDEEIGELLEDDIAAYGTGQEGDPKTAKKHIDAAGIMSDKDGEAIVIYEMYSRLKVDDERRLCKILYAGGTEGKERVPSVRLNPYWNDKCPLISAAQNKLSGAFKGASKIAAVDKLQYGANDVVNEGWDSAAYALLPIIMTDPTKNPRTGSMVLNLAAIWETSPNDTKFAQFPPLWKDAFSIVASAKTEIFQVLSVSPAAIAQSTGQKVKRNQAEIANEQQVDILSTADVCTNIEDEILTPLLRWFVDLDHQFREKPITVREYGQMGLATRMEEIPPIESNRRYEFRWFGVEAARNAQAIQMQISAMNVIKGIPPDQYKGYEINLVPVISLLVENAFGSRMAPEIFRNLKSKLSMAPDEENKYLKMGLALPVHELDEDQKHMQEHMQAMEDGDPTGAVREHMMLHRFQMEKKMQAQMAQMMQMQRGPPPGGSPGQAGGQASPRQGAAAGSPRGGQAPPGAVHADRLQDAAAAPRR